jgi:protein-disulfide isomerase/uncharacterized membrane protein
VVTPAPKTWAAPVLLGSSAAALGLAIYQWFELLALRAGGTVSCAVNATVNCGTVWNSPFASNLHATLGVPVAGLGVVWAAGALVLSALALLRKQGALVASVKVAAIVGLLSSLVFAVASFSIGAVCLTCLGTYALVSLFGIGALFGFTGPALPSSDTATGGLGWAAVVMAVAFLACLYPGSKTPKASASAITATQPGDDLAQMFSQLPEQVGQMAALAREQWRNHSVQDTGPYPQRARWGPANAPVHIVDFTDILCAHCKHFEEGMTEVKRAAPAGSLSFEARHFPLDGECNPDINRVWGDGVRCAAAKALICLEGSDKLWSVREALFARQPDLSKDDVFEVASQALPRMALDACMASEETKKKLADDIAYAKLYKIEGTPLVLLNGRETLPSEVFILGMAAAKGDAEAPLFKVLPPAPPMPSHGHE